jgi:hypothetical protein
MTLSATVPALRTMSALQTRQPKLTVPAKAVQSGLNQQHRQPQFGMGPINFPSGTQILATLGAFAAVVGLAGVGIGYLVSQGNSKKEPETVQTPVQTPVKTTADEVQSLQQQLDAKKAQLEQERLDLEAKLNAVKEAENKLK